MPQLHALISTLFWNDVTNKWTVSFQYKGEVYEFDFGNFEDARKYQIDMMAKCRLAELEN